MAAVTPPRSSNGRGTPTNAQPSSQITNVQNVTTGLENSTINNTMVRLFPRSAPGTRGQRVNALTNHFAVNVDNFKPSIYKWNAVVRKEGDNKDVSIGRVKRRVLQLLLKNPPYNHDVYTDYDKTLFSFKTLSSSSDASEIVYVDYYEPEETGPRPADRKLRYAVRITKAALPLPTIDIKRLKTNPNAVLFRKTEYEEALNVMFLKQAVHDHLLITDARAGKVFPFSANGSPRDIGHGLCSYRGYIYRLRINSSGLQLVVNSTASAMYEEGQAHSIINKWIPFDDSRPANIKKTIRNQDFKGVRVRARFGTRRVKSIYCIMHNINNELAMPSQVTFMCDRHPRTGAIWNTIVSVEWYFKVAYPDVKPNPNSIQMVLNVGSERYPVYWLASLCDILPGQPFKRLLPDKDQTTKMIEFACRDANKNRELIENEGLRTLGITHNAPGSKIGTALGTGIQTLMSMSTVNARRIQPPSILFSQSKLLPRDIGNGTWNLISKKFYGRGNRINYAVIDLK